MITCTTYEELLMAAVKYFRHHGINEFSISMVEESLPPEWSSDITAEAIDLLEETPC